ncbi:MAG TPA: HAD family hydrolase [Propionibacteriaceae bacterium]|nr:HAD family hydrolase [Propionibacteriaceae bacterium]
MTHVVEDVTTDPSAAVLTAHTPTKDHFIGIDSDGCVFDAMEIKHKECFIPATIKCWHLQAASSLVRETAEFVNLYSDGRGLNRWVALLRVFDLLAERPEVAQRGVRVPTGNALRRFVASGYPLSGTGLRRYAALHPDPELEDALTWTDEVDARIADMVHDVPPFRHVRESLVAASATADLMVVSATPLDALTREWTEHDLARHMNLIAGQEQGTKGRHLELAAKGRYADDHILLIGDAPADRDTAAAQGVLFYPINPGDEEASWRRFHDEALERFLDGRYAGPYQDALVAHFTSLLPHTPSWRI